MQVQVSEAISKLQATIQQLEKEIEQLADARKAKRGEVRQLKKALRALNEKPEKVT